MTDIVKYTPAEVAEEKTKQIEMFRTMLANSPDGEYYIPNMRILTMTLEGYALQKLLSQLSMIFPQFRWSQSDSIDPNVMGLTIRWERK